MNKKQKGQVLLAALFTVLFICWLFLIFCTEYGIFGLWCRILNLISSALGVLAMVISYREEEKIKKKQE